MGHGFKNLGKNTSFVTKREPAWHGLGKVVDAMTSKEAIELGGLNYEVGLADLYASTGGIWSDYNHKPTSEKDIDIFTWRYKEDGANIDSNTKVKASKIHNNFATYRKDTKDIFGVVGSKYEVIQNWEAFDFFDTLIGEGHAQYETVGALGNGEVVFITAKIPGHILVDKDKIDKYLLLTMAHNGTSAIRIMFTPIRVVCNNTLQCALDKRGSKVSIRHTKNAREKLEAAKKTLGLIDAQTRLMQDLFDRLAKQTLYDRQVHGAIEQVFALKRDDKGQLSTRAKNKIQDVTNYYYNGLGQEEIVGTGYGLYNGITGYLQNVRDPKNPNSFFSRTFMGQDEVIRNKAINTILSL